MPTTTARAPESKGLTAEESGSGEHVPTYAFRNCEFCGCHTNARLRGCCDRGRAADKALSQQFAPPSA